MTFALVTLYDWSAKLMPLTQPIRDKTKTNHVSCLYLFSRAWCWLHVIALNADWLFVIALNADWLFVMFLPDVISQSNNADYLLLQQSNKNWPYK